MVEKVAAISLVAALALGSTPALAASTAPSTAGEAGSGATLRSTAPFPKGQPKPAPKKKRKVKYKKGKASWYGPGFYGHGMAGGGVLKRTSMVLAHRTLPFGTKVRVVWKGRSVVATVRDRGPFVSGRVFDLGPGVAHKLRFSGVQTIKYRILKLGKKKSHRH
jgi:rare lipoprotein A